MLQFKQNPYTDQDLAAARAGVDQAQAQQDLAELGARDTTVTAPVDGVVSERLQSPGALVSPQTPIVTLALPTLELVVDIEQSHLSHLDIGQTVQIQVDASPGQTFGGRIATISPTIDPRSRTAAVRIQPQDGNHLLRPGMYAQVNIVTAAQEGVLLVPTTALLDGSSVSATAVVAIQNGIAERRPVTVGLQNNQFAEIRGGLSEGDLVTTGGLNEITDGEYVIVQTSDSPVGLAR